MGYFLLSDILGDITFNFDDDGYLHISHESKSNSMNLNTSPTNCKNCGAILHYKENKCKCEYCGTEYN